MINNKNKFALRFHKALTLSQDFREGKKLGNAPKQLNKKIKLFSTFFRKTKQLFSYLVLKNI